MSKENGSAKYALSELESLTEHLKEAVSVAKKSNKHARKRNRLVKLQHRQAALNYEQAERQYLIEKSRMQPKFRLTATEFLLCEPDFLNDPELASEAKFLSGYSVAVDERVLRVKIHVSGGAEYMRPSVVFTKSSERVCDELAYSMTELICFIPVTNIGTSDNANSSLVYLVYQDKTTLPVILKYQLVPNHDSALPRWDVVHLDTVYATSHKGISTFSHSQGCAALFSDRESS